MQLCVKMAIISIMKIYQVDAFTDQPFKGNPAAVCFPDSTCTDEWMASLAAEMNLSETAFLSPMGDKNSYHLRWFTPKGEVDLCGHATLASSHILWATGKADPHEPISFQTLSGRLGARMSGDWITLDFPAEAQKAADVPDQLEEAIGASIQYFGANRMDYLVEVDSEATLLSLKPDFKKLMGLKTRGLIVTARPSRGRR